MTAQRETGSESQPLLSAVGITKSYGSLLVLKGVNIDVRPGEIHALVGENGAGKSTLVNILAGYLPPDTGTVTAGGQVIWDGPNRVTAESSVGMVHQELSVLPDLTVKENLLIGDPEVGFFNRRRRDAEIARRRLAEVGLTDLALDRRTETLSLAEQQLLEIARIVGRKQSVIILDEPTATLSDAEIEVVFKTLDALREAGHGILYISHRLREIFRLADRVTTLRNGEHIATDPIGDIDTDMLVEKMLGESQSEKRQDLEEATVRERVGAPIVEIRGLRSPGNFEEIDISIWSGQILGIIGQVGSGADQVVRAIAGLDPLAQGEVTIEGEQVSGYDLNEAQRRGVWSLSESRKRDGLFLSTSVAENLTSPVLDRVSTGGVVHGRRQRALATKLAERFTVRVNRLDSPVENLSGGNQQKVAVAKVVSVDPRVLVLSEPTRGVDVGARTEIYEQLRGLVEEGVAVVVFTSDVTEAIELCDEIVTMFRGHKINERTVREGIEAELLGDILHGGDSA